MPARNYPPGLAAAVGAAVTTMLAKPDGEPHHGRIKIASRDFKISVIFDETLKKSGALIIKVDER